MDSASHASTAGVGPGNAPASGGTTSVLWRRSIDRARQRRRWRNLALFYVVPSGIAMLGGLAFGGVGPFLGLLILLGLIGLLFAAWIALLNLNERMNPEIVLHDGSLVLGRRSVRIADVERWSTGIVKQRTSVGAPNRRSHSFSLAKVLFRVATSPEGTGAPRPGAGPAFEVVAFAWPAMSADDLEAIRVALEPHLPAPYVPREEIRA